MTELTLLNDFVSHLLGFFVLLYTFNWSLLERSQAARKKEEKSLKKGYNI